MEQDITIYLAKAEESLRTAESEFANSRYNSCANRCYYACFQAAIAAFLAEGIRVGVLINQRHLYDRQLRRVLSDNQSVREKADYRPELVNATQASRALRRTRTFVAAVRQRGGVT